MAEPKLKDYIQAGYPCLFLRTIEPLTAENDVRRAMVDLNIMDYFFGIWKVTNGLMVGRPDSSDPGTYHNRADDLLEALSYVEDVKDERQPMVAVFHNVRQFMANHGVIQKMIDTIYRARLKGSHVVLVGAYLELPPELKNLVQYIDCPLPTVEQINIEYTKLTKAYSDRITLPKDKTEREELIQDCARAVVGLDMMAAENAISLSIATAGALDIKIIQQQKEQEVRKSDVLEFFSTEESMDTLGGFQALKSWLSKRIEAFTPEAREYGLSYPKGFLIVGPAGTGKSLCAKVVSSFMRLPLLRFDMGKIFRSLQGESEAAVRQALQVCEAVAPVVVWMDEIEKGMAGMAGSGELDSGVSARVISTILTWRQETRKPVLLVATANNVSTLPSMVYRKGRLDEVWATDLPTLEERMEIFKIHLQKRKRDPKNFKLELLADQTPDFVGAEVEGVIEDAMFTAFTDGVEVADKHILKAIKDTIPQAIRDEAEIKAIRGWVQTRARLVSGGEPPKKEGASIRKLHTTDKKGGKK